MDDEEFREVIRTVVGTVVGEPEFKKLAGTGKIFSFGATDAKYSWYLDFTNAPAFSEGLPERFDVRATMTKADWLDSLSGKLSSTQAMLRRKLHVEGSMMAISSLSMEALIRTYKEKMKGNAR